MNINEKAAEILVDCGYAERRSVEGFIRIKDPRWTSQSGLRPEKVDSFSDSLEGRRQADAIEDWLHSSVKLRNLWQRSLMHFGFRYEDNHQWRLERIKWCLAELCK